MADTTSVQLLEETGRTLNFTSLSIGGLIVVMTTSAYAPNHTCGRVQNDNACATFQRVLRGMFNKLPDAFDVPIRLCTGPAFFFPRTSIKYSGVVRGGIVVIIL